MNDKERHASLLADSVKSAEAALELSRKYQKDDGSREPMSETDAAEYNAKCADSLAFKKEADELAVEIGLSDIIESSKTPQRKTYHNIEPMQSVKSLGAQVLGDRDAWGDRVKAFAAANNLGRVGSATIDMKTTLTSGADSGGDLIVPQFGGLRAPMPMPRYRIRDVLASGTTTSNLLEYVQETTVAGDLLAAEVTDTGEISGESTKPESGISFQDVQEAVKTIAHWLPVTTQTLSDYPQMMNLINGRLLWGLHRREARQLLWGDGTGVNLEGLMNRTGILNAATSCAFEAGDTILDRIRRMITVVSQAGYEPSFVGMTPYHKETLDLLKGSDEHYIYGIYASMIGPQVWMLAIVEDPNFEDPDNNVDNIVVGDGRMAEVTDRETANVEVGLIDKYFVQNKRAVLAEERLALQVFAPGAFIYYADSATS